MKPCWLWLYNCLLHTVRRSNGKHQEPHSYKVQHAEGYAFPAKQAQWNVFKAILSKWSALTRYIRKNLDMIFFFFFLICAFCPWLVNWKSLAYFSISKYMLLFNIIKTCLMLYGALLCSRLVRIGRSCCLYFQMLLKRATLSKMCVSPF